MRPLSISLLALAAAAACEPVAPPPAEPLLFLEGYRDPADPCRRIGENATSSPFLDDAADLVGCPEGAENLGVFVTETGGVEVARLQGTVLFSVPRG